MIPLDQLAPISHPTLDTFLLGILCASSLFAAIFFLRFWRNTHDVLFLAFAVFFAIEGFNEAYQAALPHPNIGTFAVSIVRLFAVLSILGAIVWKNFAER